MKKILLAFAAAILFLQASAQLPAFKKDWPVQILRADIYLYSATDFATSSAARKSYEAQFGNTSGFEKMMLAAFERNYPEAINDPKGIIEHEKDFEKYKAYWQFSWLHTAPGQAWAQRMHLVWIPKDENSQMPAGMVPGSEDGLIMILSDAGITKTSFPKPSTPAKVSIDAMKSKHSKMNAEIIDSADNKVMPTYGRAINYAFGTLNEKGYNEKEIERIAQLADQPFWPAAFQVRDWGEREKTWKAVSNYKAYKILQFSEPFSVNNLYWIPKEENKHMPANMQPLTDEGFFMVARASDQKDDYLLFDIRGATARGRKGFLIAGMPRKNGPVSSLSATASNSGSVSSPSTANTVASSKVAEGSIRHKESKPQYILYEDGIWSTVKLANWPDAKESLETSGKFTGSEFAKISILANEESYPPAIKTKELRRMNLEMTKNYNAYKVADFMLNSSPHSLLWVPKGENKHMPAEMQPPTDEGFYMAVRNSSISETKIGSSSTAVRGMSKPSNSYTTDNGIQVSSADMSQFTNNSSLGAMILYYGSGTTISSAYIYDLRGKSLTDKAGVAGILSGKISGSSFIGFEHRLGNCAAAEGYVKGKAGKTISTRCMGEYKVD